MAGKAVISLLDVALTGSARCFFSTVLDAMGTEPDAAYRIDLEPEPREALVVGRPIAQAPVTPRGPFVGG